MALFIEIYPLVEIHVFRNVLLAKENIKILIRNKEVTVLSCSERIEQIAVAHHHTKVLTCRCLIFHTFNNDKLANLIQLLLFDGKARVGKI